MKKNFFLLIVLSVLCMGYILYQFVFPMMADHPVENKEGQNDIYGLGLFKKDGSIENDTLHAKEIDVLNMKITNGTKQKTKFLVHLYMNYERINFKRLDDKKMIDRYELDIDGKSDKVIPIQIPKEKLVFQSNPMVIELVSDPHTHASSSNNLSYTNGVMARYDVINDKSVTLKHPEPKEVSLSHIVKRKGQFSGLMINKDVSKIDEFISPDVRIDAKPNEMIELTIRYGGLEKSKNYLF